MKELIAFLYTEFVENPQAQSVLPELVQMAEAYQGLEEQDFANVISETIAKIKKCRHDKEVEQIRKVYKRIDDDDPEALKIQIQLRDKIRNKIKKSEMN